MIDLAAVPFDSTGSVTIDNATNLLHVTEGGVTRDIQLDPGENYAGAQFAAASDGGSGTAITMTMGPTAPPVTPPGTTAEMIVQDTGSGVLRLYDLGDNATLADYVIGQVGLDWQLLGVGTSCGRARPTTSNTTMSRTARSPPPGRWAISGRNGRCWGLAISAATPARATC